MEGCNPAKFSASVMTPAGGSRGPRGRGPGGRRRATARIHVMGMTSGKCVKFITTKVVR